MANENALVDCLVSQHLLPVENRNRIIVAMVSPRMPKTRHAGTVTATKSAKDEILVLREDVKDLKEVLARLQRKRRDVLSRESPWKKLAYDQSAQRLETLQENERLRAAVAECRAVATGLVQLTQRVRPSTQELMSREETEWKLDVLGSHPSRRHYNADRIMDRLYRKIPSWSITSGLVDAVQDTQYSRSDHRASAEQSMRVEVAMCRGFNGHYVDIANAVWKYLGREELEAEGANWVRVEGSDILGDRIRLKTRRVRTVVNGHTVEHLIHELCRRVEEDTRIVILWKTVADTLDAAPPKLAENADGWISFEKAMTVDRCSESCLMKLSSTKQVLPVDLMLQRTGNNPHRLIKLMNFASGLESPTQPRERAPKTVEDARLGFADHLTSLLWHRVKQVEQVATRASSAPIGFVSL